MTGGSSDSTKGMSRIASIAASPRSMTSCKPSSGSTKSATWAARMSRLSQVLGAVVGYYTLASGAIAPQGLPAKQAKKLPRHAVPVVLLARLAVDQGFQGKGLGGFLLRDALNRSLDLSEKLGIHAVIVDAIDAEAKTFYERFGFLALTDDQMRLFLPLSTIRSAVGRRETRE